MQAFSCSFTRISCLRCANIFEYGLGFNWTIQHNNLEDSWWFHIISLSNNTNYTRHTVRFYCEPIPSQVDIHLIFFQCIRTSFWHCPGTDGSCSGDQDCIQCWLISEIVMCLEKQNLLIKYSCTSLFVICWQLLSKMYQYW